MHGAARFTLLSIVLLLPLLSGFAWGQYIGVPGPGLVAPAPGLSASSVLSNEGSELPPPPPGDVESTWEVGRNATPASGEVQETQSAVDSTFFLRANFKGTDGGNGPADPTMAAGLSRLLLGTNHFVALLDKAGGVVDEKILIEFFGNLRQPGENAGDPRIIFDPHSSRFFVVATGRILDPSCTPGTCIGHIFLAVSKTSNPTTLSSTDWYFYVFDGTLDGATPTVYWSDFPGLGVDDKAVVISSIANNQMGYTEYARIRILDKSKLISGTAVTWTDFFRMEDPLNGATAINFQPALHSVNPGTFFLVSASMAISCGLVVWGIKNPLTSPTLSALTAPAGGQCDSPPHAPQLGGGPLLDTGNKWQLSATMYRNGSLWTARSIAANFGSGAVSAIRWSQIDVTDWPNSIGFVQDSIFGADRVWYFYPAITVDASDNVVIVFARSSASEFVSAYYTGRLSIDPLNTFRPDKLLKAGSTNIDIVFDDTGVNRWGDYFGIALDPNDGSVWMHGEYARVSDSWGTWVGNIVAPVGIKAAFESPEAGPVSSIAVIRGWVFATQPGVSISKVELFIDGVSAGDIPCCSDRADVQTAFPQFPAPNTLNSGWGTTFNWGVLNAGTHAVQVVIHNTAGEQLATETRTVTVVKPGDFEFLDQFSLSGATARIESDQLVVEGAVVRDKASQQKKLLNARYRWFTSSQSPQTVEAVTSGTAFSGQSFFSGMLAALSEWFLGLPGAPTAQASPGIVRSFESPEVNQVVSGVAVIRGWAFTDTQGASLTEVRLVIDGMPSSSIPCCSQRGDVAAAYPGNPNALNSGWGFTINYGNFPAGFHNIGIRFGDSVGASVTDTHGVTVVKVGGFAFLDQFNLSGATAKIEGEEIVLSGVQVRDKASQQTRIVEVRLRWFQSSQALGIVASAG